VNAIVDDTSVEIGDGSFTDWTARLLANAKERLLITGYGLNRLAALIGEPVGYAWRVPVAVRLVPGCRPRGCRAPARRVLGRRVRFVIGSEAGQVNGMRWLSAPRIVRGI
jgi:hypothetical protein